MSCIGGIGSMFSGSTIYGTGTTNQVVPGYDVAFPPVNLCAWRGTGRGVIRDFGMQNQYVQLPPGYQPMAYYLANHPCLMETNPLLLGMLPSGGAGCGYCFMA